MNESLLSTAGSSPFVPVAAMEEGFGPGFIQSPQAAKGTHCRHKPGRTKSDKAGCPLLPWDLQGVKTMFRDTVSSRRLASG